MTAFTRRFLPHDGTERLMVLTQVLCVATMLLAATHPFGLRASIMGCGALLLVCLGLVSAAAARAHREAHDTVRRIVFAGLSGAALCGLLAELVNLAWHVLYPHRRVFPSPGFWLVLFGTHPCLLLGYASAIGWRPRGLRVE